MRFRLWDASSEENDGDDDDEQEGTTDVEDGFASQTARVQLRQAKAVTTRGGYGRGIGRRDDKRKDDDDDNDDDDDIEAMISGRRGGSLDQRQTR
jgi:hypothetical protein